MCPYRDWGLGFYTGKYRDDRESSEASFKLWGKPYGGS